MKVWKHVFRDNFWKLPKHKIHHSLFRSLRIFHAHLLIHENGLIEFHYASGERCLIKRGHLHTHTHTQWWAWTYRPAPSPIPQVPRPQASVYPPAPPPPAPPQRAQRTSFYYAPPHSPPRNRHRSRGTASSLAPVENTGIGQSDLCTVCFETHLHLKCTVWMEQRRKTTWLATKNRPAPSPIDLLIKFLKKIVRKNRESYSNFPDQSIALEFGCWESQIVFISAPDFQTTWQV